MPRSLLYARAIDRYLSHAQRHDVTVRLNQVYADEKRELDPVDLIPVMRFVPCDS